MFREFCVSVGNAYFNLGNQGETYLTLELDYYFHYCYWLSSECNVSQNSLGLYGWTFVNRNGDNGNFTLKYIFIELQPY